MRHIAARGCDEHRATALWCERKDTYALASAPLPPVGSDAVRLVAIASAVSRGTERLVLEGRVPASETERMRCPHQEGEFPFPVKYGYALVGRIAEGPAALIGRIGFALHPHQSAAVVAADAVSLVPEGVPPRRATLAANLETALNIVWDSGASLGDRVLVIGAGVVGLLVARLLSRIAGVEVTLADADPAKRAAAEAMGAAFAAPHSLPADVDVAINATGSDAGLDMAIAAAGLEARIVEASWHGEGTQRVTLGGAFHARRLTIQSSQVGRIPAARAARWTHRRRLATVMRLLEDDALDALISHEVPLAEAPARLPGLLKEPGALGILITYDAQGA